MSKQISSAELAELVSKLLTNPEIAGELAEFHAYKSFMTQIAQVVCDHCGGEVRNEADPLDDVWYVGIHGNDSLPPGSEGVWNQYDPEGELFDPEENVASAPRDIFAELCTAVGITVGSTRATPVEQPLVVRRDLVASEILQRYPGDLKITAERFQANDSFGECLIWLHSHFSIAAWEGRLLAAFLGTYASNQDDPGANVVQYRTNDTNAQGTRLGFITLDDLRNATTLGESGWLLPDGSELWLHTTKAGA